MNLLAIDLSTSSVKVLITSSEGNILGRAEGKYPIARSGSDRAEQSPEAWWQTTVTAVRQALAEARSPAHQHVDGVAAIGLSGQMHGTVLMDGDNRLLSPAVIWPDRRSQRQVDEISGLVGEKSLINIAGSPLATGFQAATVCWFQQHHPEIWSRVSHLLTPKAYLIWRLTGRFVTDPSDGSGTLLMDVRKRDWSADLLDHLRIDRRQLPSIQPADTVAGNLTAPAAEHLGLNAGTPVMTGAADTACAALGAGVINASTLLIAISSGGQIVLPIQEVKVDFKGRIHTFCGALTPRPGRSGWYQLAATLSAGLSLRWLREQAFALDGDDAYRQMAAWAAEAPAGANGLLFLPYLTGERSPVMDSRARGVFLGLTANHGRAELVRAVMEGVAMACYDAYTVLVDLGAQPRGIIMAGGGAKSPLWRQILADIFNLPVRPLMVEEQSAIGAALLAGSGLDWFDPGKMAVQWATYGDPSYPDQQHYALYGELFSIFRSIYRQHCETFAQLALMAKPGTF